MYALFNATHAAHRQTRTARQLAKAASTGSFYRGFDSYGHLILVDEPKARTFETRGEAEKELARMAPWIVFFFDIVEL